MIPVLPDPLPTGLEGDPRMAPHRQVRDVDSVEDYVFHASAEIMPIGEVLLCGADQTPDEHLRGVWGVRFPGCGSEGTFLALPAMQLYERLETHISPVSVLKLEARWASRGVGSSPEFTTSWQRALA